jgi:hypothetical protein
MTMWTSRQADQPVHGHANQPALPNACALQCMSVIYIVIDCLCPKFYTNVSFQKEHVCGGGQVQVMMVKATGDLRQEVKKVAVITPRFGAESTPAEKASSGLFSMLEVESDLKVTVTVQTSFGPITKFIKVDGFRMVLNKSSYTFVVKPGVHYEFEIEPVFYNTTTKIVEPMSASSKSTPREKNMRCKPGGTTDIFYPKDFKDYPYQIRNFVLFCNTTFKCSGGKMN